MAAHLAKEAGAEQDQAVDEAGMAALRARSPACRPRKCRARKTGSDTGCGERGLAVRNSAKSSSRRRKPGASPRSWLRSGRSRGDRGNETSITGLAKLVAGMLVPAAVALDAVDEDDVAVRAAGRPIAAIPPDDSRRWR